MDRVKELILMKNIKDLLIFLIIVHVIQVQKEQQKLCVVLI